MTELHHCPDCDDHREFATRREGNLRTGEQWEVTYCVECRWERERRLIRGKVIHVEVE